MPLTLLIYVLNTGAVDFLVYWEHWTNCHKNKSVQSKNREGSRLELESLDEQATAITQPNAVALALLVRYSHTYVIRKGKLLEALPDISAKGDGFVCSLHKVARPAITRISRLRARR